jgi:hypothetical protein
MSATFSKEQIQAELARRQGTVNAGYQSVLANPQEETALDTVKKVGESLLKGSTRGVIDMIGGWGNLYDYLKKSQDPSAFSTAGIAQGIQKLSGIDIQTIPGYRGAYEFGAAGAPAAVTTALGLPGLFGRTAKGIAGEFGAGGATGLMAQTIAPESPLAQVALQASPYLIKGGIVGAKSYAENKAIKDFVKDMPPELENKFKNFMVRGQGSDDPEIASLIQRLRVDPKYAEIFAKLEQGATAAATEGMQPQSKITNERQAGISAAQAVQNKILKLFEERKNAGSAFFEKAKEYGGDRGIIAPDNVLTNVNNLIGRYSKGATDSSRNALAFLQKFKEQIAVPDLAMVETKTPQKLTVDQTQSLLSEFGRKASQGESLIKDIALTDEKIISSAIFGGLKDDLRAARIAAKTPEDIAATNLLITARNNVQKASEAYTDAIAQGIPNFLKDKSLSEVSFDKLYGEYKNLDPYNRGLFRKYVEDTDVEALKFIDKNVYDDFINSARKENRAGVMSVDLGTLASNWDKLPKNSKDALVQSLGTNADEFATRMKDAGIFARKMQVSGVSEAGDIVPQGLKASAAATVGAGAGYEAAKAAQVGIDLLNMVGKGGLTDDMVMKALLTPEGADFLKTGSLTPRSQKTLDALTSMSQSSAVPKFIGAQLMRAGPQMSTEPPVIQQETPTGMPQAPVAEQPQFSKAELEAELLRRQQEQGGGGESPYPRIELNNMSPSQP